MNNRLNLKIKCINNYNYNIEGSYINTVLQSFVNLDCVNYWIKIINNTQVMNKIDASLTKEFYQIFVLLLSGQQNVDSTNLIFHFENKIKSIYKKEIKNDPYHFFYYFLELLHFENNNPQNPNYNINNYKNQNFENMKDDSYMLKSDADYFQQTQNSIISDYFYNTEKYQFQCQNCPTIYYYGHKKIFYFNVDKFRIYRDSQFPFKAGQNLSLEDCFLCYQGGNKLMCPNCGNLNSFGYTKIFTSTKVIIIAFKRNKHVFKGDINFGHKFSISNFVIHNTISSMNYALKSIIYRIDNKIKYCVDVLINNNWFRFFGNQIKKVAEEKELYRFEPVMLIYELINDQTNYMNPFYKQANIMNNNNFFVPTQQQQIMAQMMQLKMMKMMEIIQQNLMLNQFVMRVNNNNNNNMNVNGDMQTLGIILNFLVIPEDWDNSPENSLYIKVHVTTDDTIEKAINNFFIKLQKPREAITKFVFNGIEIETNSQDKLRDLNINEESVIYAYRADNFDSLNLF